MISTENWRLITPAQFEELAVEHVRDIYPQYKWRSTKYVGDGGRDAFAEINHIDSQIKELYWMEAKHKPGDFSIGKYTLDTHLVSTLFSGELIKRLHVVTSGRLSDPFIVRAKIFASEHQFEFAYSDNDTLECWLRSRPDYVKKLFKKNATTILTSLSDQRQEMNLPIIARAFIMPEKGTFDSPAGSTEVLIPGLKYLMVISLSISQKIAPSVLPLTLQWLPNPEFIYLFNKEIYSDTGFKLTDFPKNPVQIFPFRILRFGNTPFPEIIMSGQSNFSQKIILRNSGVLPKLVSSFVGEEPRALLIESVRLLENKLFQHTPLLIIFKGKAGAGKSRLADEILDEAQRMGAVVKTLKISSSSPETQSEQWRLFFRWIFGIEHNPFDLHEETLIERSLNLSDAREENVTNFKKELLKFLKFGHYNINFFNLDLNVGKWFSDLVISQLSQRIGNPIVIHIEDVHRLPLEFLRPLYFLKHLIDARDNFPFCIIITCRTDETIIDRSVEHFIRAIESSQSDKLKVFDVNEFNLEDAREMVETTLLWPELQSTESRVRDSIIKRAGTNAFFLMQILNYIGIDNGCLEFGYGKGGFLVNPEKFKKALKLAPKNIKAILNQRFEGLKQLYKHNLLEILVANALIGREAKIKMVNAGVRKKIEKEDINKLLMLGYLSYADDKQIVLSHDLLVESLLENALTRDIASRLSRNLNNNKSVKFISGDFQYAKILFYSGPKYYKKCWQYAQQLVKLYNKKQDYLSIVPSMQILELIEKNDPKKFILTNELELVAGFVDQHCGNTKSGLERFLKLRHKVKNDITKRTPLKIYIKSTIEACNQYYLRAEPSEAKKICDEIIELLNDTKLPIEKKDRLQFLALSHNRSGAIYHSIDKTQESFQEFCQALLFADKIKDFYLYAHTLWNLGALYRFSKQKESLTYFERSKIIWNERLKSKERFRIMLDTSEAYTLCLKNNTQFSRSKLYSISAEAAEKGYLFQASSALLCFSASAIFEAKWEDAKEALLKILNLTAFSEDLKARIYAYHYLTICAFQENNIVDALNYGWQAYRQSLFSDKLFDNTALKRIIYTNYHFLKGDIEEADIIDDPIVKRSGKLSWVLFNRA